MNLELFWKLLFLCAMLFLAGLIDGVAGGGGIISFPAYLMAGLPLNAAYGCNKLQSCLGTATALVRYARSGMVDLKSALCASVTALIGSYTATQILLRLSDATIKLIIAVAMCFVITLTLLADRLSSGEIRQIALTKQNLLLCLAVGLALGLYDGFFGPGGGTIALMLFTVIFRYDMRTANGNGKVVIVVSNLIALVSHIANGNVWLEYAIPSTLSNMLGCYLGAILSVKKGAGIIKKLMIAVVIVVLIQAASKLF